MENLSGIYKDLTRIDLVSKMIGKELHMLEELPKLSGVYEDTGEVLLDASKFGRKGAIEPVDLQIRKGEVIGLAGLLGSGRTELADSCSRQTVRIGSPPIRG